MSKFLCFRLCEYLLFVTQQFILKTSVLVSRSRIVKVCFAEEKAYYVFVSVGPFFWSADDRESCRLGSLCNILFFLFPPSSSARGVCSVTPSSTSSEERSVLFRHTTTNHGSDSLWDTWRQKLKNLTLLFHPVVTHDTSTLHLASVCVLWHRDTLRALCWHFFPDIITLRICGSAHSLENIFPLEWNQCSKSCWPSAE